MLAAARAASTTKTATILGNAFNLIKKEDNRNKISFHCAHSIVHMLRLVLLRLPYTAKFVTIEFIFWYRAELALQ